MITTEPIPLAIDSDGVVRVGGTRVSLDTVVTAFNHGATPETISQQYPSVALSDVYAVIGFYLRNRSKVEAYLQEREEQGKLAREINQSKTDAEGIRERLTARRNQGR
jgi:uncharacterized protein (DUF433 family)